LARSIARLVSEEEALGIELPVAAPERSDLPVEALLLPGGAETLADRAGVRDRAPLECHLGVVAGVHLAEQQGEKLGAHVDQAPVPVAAAAQRIEGLRRADDRLVDVGAV